MNKKHITVSPAQAVQRDLEAEGSSLPSGKWPTAINSVDSCIWY